MKSLKSIIAIILFIALNPLTHAEGLQYETVPVTDRYEVAIGKSTILKFEEAPVRLAISNPGIAYILQITPTEWEIIGRNTGTTHMYIWTDRETIVGTEVAVGLPTPPYFKSSRTMELLNGGSSELIYIGHPSEEITGIQATSMSGLVTDMPEPCLVPGCI